jgi:hypothetical protein
MKLNQLNLGKSLSKEEQKRIKGGYPLCDVGQYAYCACATGNICVLVTGQFESTGAVCQTYCNKPPVAGHTLCYTAATCPGGGE